MDDTLYQQLATATLTRLADALEGAYTDGALEELELDDAVLTIQPDGARPILVSKHGPTQQLWLASPRLGGLHFRREGDSWKLPDGRELLATLRAELATHGVDVAL